MLTKPTIEMYRLLIEKYPETLIMKDKWGDVPLLYAIWCNAPADVIELFVQSYKSNHPDYKFDWGGMLRLLAKANAPLKNIQTLINTQQNNFSHQEYDIQFYLLDLAAHNSNPFIETFRYILRLSITKRLDSLAVTRFREELEDSISTLPMTSGCRYIDTKALHDRLATYESIKEGTSILELALWKAKIDESRNKRARVGGEDISYKEQCRVNCRADIIIRNVLPYLLPDDLTIDSSPSGESSDSDDSNEEDDWIET